MSKGMIFKGRSEAIHTGQFLIPIWDLVPMSVWERYVYIELCSWAGINSGGDWIRFSPLTMARKYRIGDSKAERKILSVIISTQQLLVLRRSRFLELVREGII
jgi:hypothetical protein